MGTKQPTHKDAMSKKDIDLLCQAYASFTSIELTAELDIEDTKLVSANMKTKLHARLVELGILEN